MKTLPTLALIALAGASCASVESNADSAGPAEAMAAAEAVSSLGAFSVSLTVADLAASQAFYEKLGFVVSGGDAAQNWLVLRNGKVTVGIFHGMFEDNIMTFNPGWTAAAQPITPFTDIRELQRQLKAKGLTMITEADETTTGPASLVLLDPDGNMILIDQHL